MHAKNLVLDHGGYRPVNLQLPPFGLPPPMWEFVDAGGENPKGAGRDGTVQMLGLWRLSDIDV